MRLSPTQRGAARIIVFTAFIGGFIACGSATNKPVLQINVTPAATGLQAPVDATPDPMGTQIFFLATGMGGPGVFEVPAVGGTPQPLHVGAPLVAPESITVSSDGKTLFVADPSAGTDGKGVIFTLPSSGDTPAPLAGTADTHPTGLDIGTDGATDTLYFTGQDSGGTPAIFQMPTAGGTPTVVLKGAPLASPGGVAVASDGSVYVFDAKAGTGQPGQVFEVTAGQASTRGPELAPGSPAGLAVTVDGSRLLASSLDPQAGTSQVELILTSNTSYGAYNKTINVNTVSGGIHRARFKDIYAWAGKTQVYFISAKPISLLSSTIGGVGVD